MSFSKQPSWYASPIQINSTAISGDGSRCLLGTSNEYSSGLFSVVAYDDAGTVLWTDPITNQASYQGVFWVALSDNGQYAAAGGEVAKSGDNPGFLRIYNAESGEVLLSVSLPRRVNQVSFSSTGSLLIASYGQYISLYKNTDGSFSEAGVYDLGDNYDCGSVVMCQYGSYASAAVTNYSTTPASGEILCFSTTESQLNCVSRFATSVGAVRTAISVDGTWWGASMHDGSCVAFSNQNYDQPQWIYTPPADLLGGKSLSVAYGFDMVINGASEIIFSVGANIEGGDEGKLGCLYSVTSQYENGVFVPALKWLNFLQYSPNPGVSMDLDGKYVTATDGKPGGSTAETPGNFYLYDWSTGAQVFQYPTEIMNWPMNISSKGNAIFGASDTGLGYYWKG